MPKISVCIPTYEMHGIGVQMLERNLEMLEKQTFKDFEVVVSDNSNDLKIFHLCRDFDLDINYEKSLSKGNAANRNNAIKMAKGELIKMLDQDDYFASEKSLQDIVNNFDERDNWLITGCSNNHFPRYQENANTLGSPSVLTIRNKDPLFFNEDLKWVLDLDYYRRMNKKYGLPKILQRINVIIGIGEHQNTNHIPLEIKLKEEQDYAS